MTYRKIPQINPRAYIFRRPYLRGLQSEPELTYGGTFALQNRLGYLITEKKFMRCCTIFALFYFVFEGNFQL